MIPILFKPKTTNFATNGIGRLSDAISCYVTEERNGVYELELKYPITGLFYENIAHSSCIYAECGNEKKTQAFEVYKISKPLNGIVTVNARHISYQLSYIPCSPFSASGAAEALQGLKDNAAINCPFDFWTDKTTAAEFTVAVPSSIRSRLGGNQGSILDVYGGEYEFDMFNVKLHANRGKNNGVVLKYGKNITDLKQEENIENTVTGIYPYWSNTEGNLVTLPEKVVMSDNSENFPNTRVIPVDFSQEFDSAPTEEELREKTAEYMKAHNIGIPSVSISVSFEVLWQAEGYENIEPLEKVDMCDMVTVEYEKLGVNATAKVVKTIYDTLKGKYKSIEIGEAKATLASAIAAQEKKLDEKPSKGFLDAAVKNATAWITGVNGGYVILHKNAEGQPYEILIMDAPDMETAKNVWRWNMNGWGYSKSGYNGPYNMAATIDGGLVADYITAGTMLANRIKGGILQLGGFGNGNGVIQMLDADGNVIGIWDSSGITAEVGRIGRWKFADKYFTGYKSDGTTGFVFGYDETTNEFYFVCDGKVESGKEIQTQDAIVWGNLDVYGEKNRVVKTKNGNVRMSAYETASPCFGDIGFGEINTEGVCRVDLDATFIETVSLNEYAVFLQAEGAGDLYVKGKDELGFVVFGNPGIKFAYEIKAKQKGYENKRLEVVT